MTDPRWPESTVWRGMGRLRMQRGRVKFTAVQGGWEAAPARTSSPASGPSVPGVSVCALRDAHSEPLGLHLLAPATFPGALPLILPCRPHQRVSTWSLLALSREQVLPLSSLRLKQFQFQFLLGSDLIPSFIAWLFSLISAVGLGPLPPVGHWSPQAEAGRQATVACFQTQSTAIPAHCFEFLIRFYTRVQPCLLSSLSLIDVVGARRMPCEFTVIWG